ncbi:MAG TPA: ABC transporter ATP-binding protein [Opitutaceae bacterium]|nr:ABC transporter ATP-binding protein [Opitutaceae bacterium]
MDDNVILVEGVGKRYRLGVVRHDTFRDRLMYALQSPWRRTSTQGNGDPTEFWALRDITFDVKRGEVVGIIGRNGAGKSTLLKLLSRITEPTTGRIRLRGRVGSLLEVGTGFHPELSGRENIFLNGAVLGMKRAEIRAKFDEIVAFAEVEQFIDTPVKHYSSGMYVRLAFAVAAHLDPEILIVDEVLAVGDAAFQKKCLGKLKDVATGQQRTVLFVSHDMAAVSTLTSRCILLDKGRAVQIADTSTVLNTYLDQVRQSATYVAPADRTRPCVAAIEVKTSRGNCVQAFGEALEISIVVDHPEPIRSACLSFQIINQFNHPIQHHWVFAEDRVFADRPGQTTLTCRIPKVRLNVGTYSLRVHLSEPPGGKYIELVDGVCGFEVIRLEKPPMWGWRPHACAYHEESAWNVAST